MIFDGHSDLLTVLNKKSNVLESTYFPQLKKGQIHGGIFVIYLENPTKDNFLKLFNLSLIELSKTKVFNLVKTSKDLQIKNRHHVILGAEGLKAIEKDSYLLEKLYDYGLRHASLTWNEENDFATGVNGNPNHGVKEKGYKLLDKMQKLKMIIDLSHLNEKSFYDVIGYVKKPVICSHSNVYSLCPHKRNLKDEQLMKIKENNGVVGVVAVPFFISEEKEKQNICGMVDHIDYIKKLIGIDCVGLGFDYMGFYNNNIDNLEDMYEFSHSYKIIDELRKRKYSKEEIQKICFKNFYRVIKANFE